MIGSLGRGGAESQLLMLMGYIREYGYEPILFALEADGDLQSDIRGAGISIVDGGYDSQVPLAVKLMLLLRSLVRLWVLLLKERPRIVHGVLPLANLFAAVAGRLAAVPCVVTSRRALNTHQERVRGWRLADRLSTRLSHVVVANSEAVKRDTLQREGGNEAMIRVIHNGLDQSCWKTAPGVREQVRRELGLGADAEVLIIVANLIPYKGHRDLLQAVHELAGEHPALRLLVVGEDRGIGVELKSEAESLGIAGRILWLGLRRDVPRLLAAADLYVSASHEEGFSNSLLEALVAGKAVVATRVGGNPEMLEQGRLGVLVECGDAAGLAEAIDHLLRTPERMVEMGKRAAEYVARVYSPERMAAAYVDIYRACKERKAAR